MSNRTNNHVLYNLIVGLSLLICALFDVKIYWLAPIALFNQRTSRFLLPVYVLYFYNVEKIYGSNLATNDIRQLFSDIHNMGWSQVISYGDAEFFFPALFKISGINSVEGLIFLEAGILVALFYYLSKALTTPLLPIVTFGDLLLTQHLFLQTLASLVLIIGLARSRHTFTVFMSTQFVHATSVIFILLSRFAKSLNIGVLRFLYLLSFVKLYTLYDYLYFMVINNRGNIFIEKLVIALSDLEVGNERLISRISGALLLLLPTTVLNKFLLIVGILYNLSSDIPILGIRVGLITNALLCGYVIFQSKEIIWKFVKRVFHV